MLDIYLTDGLYYNKLMNMVEKAKRREDEETRRRPRKEVAKLRSKQLSLAQVAHSLIAFEKANYFFFVAQRLILAHGQGVVLKEQSVLLFLSLTRICVQ